jgi:hypothetical protein
VSGIYENLPFKRGATWGATAATDATHLEGKEYLVPDAAYGTGKLVRLRIVRNESGGALLPKTLVQLEQVAGRINERALGKACVSAHVPVAVVDEFLPSGGVADHDLFYVVVEGPTIAKTSLAGDGENVISAGSMLHALTAATSGATTAGRVYPAAFTGATAVLAGQIQGVVGRAMSAKTTANTNADILIDMGKF